ncbi:MAG TPA: ComEC/Rec2 family competence protein [Actinomycetes bacterium]
MRLALPALAAWVGAFVSTGGTWWLTGLLAVAGAGSLAVAVVGRRSSAWGSGPELTAAAAVVCLCGALAVGALDRAALGIGPVARLAEDGATMTGHGTVTADPVPVAARVAGPRRSGDLVVVPVRLDRVVARGRATRVRAPVVVLARGAAWTGLLPGQRIGLVGRLGPPRPTQPAAAALFVRGPPERVGRPPVLQEAAGGLRAGLRRASDGLPAAERGLLPGLVVGDTSRVPTELSEDFRTAGLTHLVAVSGANLAIVTGFVLVVGRVGGMRGRWLPATAAVAMAAFVVLARPQPSVLRAAAMGAVALAALASGRPRRSLAALSATVVVLLLVDPWLARSYGFALSVLATGGLVLLAPGWARHWHRMGLPARLAQALAVPVAAQVACAPVVAMLSEQVSLVAVPANLLVAPAVAPATILGVLATVVSAVHEPSAAGLAWTGGRFVWWVVLVARWAASVPNAEVGWPGTPSGALLLGALTAAAALVARRVARRRVPAAAAALVVVVALVVPASAPGWPPRDWLLAVCDVGQGDALVLSVGPGRAVVVDAGPDRVAADRCLRRLGVREVPVVVLSHLHADHVEGLPGVLRGRSVDEVQVGLYDQPAPELTRVLRWSAAAEVPVTRARLGDRVRIGRLRWEVVWPARVIDAGSVPNNASTVLLVRTRGVTLLLTGDVEPEAQRALLARRRLGVVDVLKVAHHGSAHQAPALLGGVRPRVAVVSVGDDNDYGHPAARTLAELRRAGAVVGRTDRDGTLVVAGTRRALRLVTGAG